MKNDDKEVSKEEKSGRIRYKFELTLTVVLLSVTGAEGIIA
jgi:hypothetical protein